MIILKHNVASKRKDLRFGEALGRIRERNGRKEAASHRAAAWRDATRRLDHEQLEIAWEMGEEQAQSQVQNCLLEREARTCLKVAKNRARTAKVEERNRCMQESRALEKQDLLAELEAKGFVADFLLDENEKQTFQKLDGMEERRRILHDQAAERKAGVDAARAQFNALEFEDGEMKRQQGAQWAYNNRMSAAGELAEANRERFERQKSNMDFQHWEYERYREAYILANPAQAAEDRRQQQALEVKNTLMQRADARAQATAACQARKEMQYYMSHQAKVEDAVARDQLGQLHMELREAEMLELIDKKASMAREAQSKAKLRIQEEKEDGRLQALAEVEEAKATFELLDIPVNMIGLKVEDQSQKLELENSLLGHETRTKRLMHKSASEDLRLLDRNGARA